MFKTIEWKNFQVRFLDQRQLPLEEKFIETNDFRVVADAISNLVERRSLIGVGAAYGMALGAQEGLNTHSINIFPFRKCRPNFTINSTNRG